MKLTALWLVSLTACAGLDEAVTTNQIADEIDSENGLDSINGLNVQNGLASLNGLHIQNGLSWVAGVANGIGLMASDAGRTTLSYMVRCALPAGRSITKKDQKGASYTFTGALGLAPNWEYFGCDATCQQWVSACMLAHINTAGLHVPLWVVADPYFQPQIGWGLNSAYPYQEGSYFGNIFTSPPQMYYCNGRNYNADVVPGRIGKDDNGGPYSNPGGKNAYCSSYCWSSDPPYTTSGYKSCFYNFGYVGSNALITVWRQ